VFSAPALRVPMLLAWLAAAYNAPEGVATPFAHDLGGGAATTGLLLAAPALGYTIGALAFGRWPPGHPRPDNVPAGAELLRPADLHRPAATLLILAASGACTCYQVTANATFVAAAPVHQRSQATGLAIAGLLGAAAALVLSIQRLPSPTSPPQSGG
jgi:MFS family permease